VLIREICGKNISHSENTKETKNPDGFYQQGCKYLLKFNYFLAGLSGATVPGIGAVVGAGATF
jgi:hypothetical protein